jgi:protein-L-isoaspartate(D-aspartate) O-methyltransferase
MRVECFVWASCFGSLGLILAASCAPVETREKKKDWTMGHAAMITQLERYGIRNPRTLNAMAKIQRHKFIPEKQLGISDPYGDHPCPIGFGQTISQPYIVAYMTERIDPQPGEKILEIGSGSGYQSAILSELGADVYTIEIIPELAEHARRILAEEGYPQVHVLTGDGYKGWPEFSLFDAILVTCAPEEIPPTLVDQLRAGGRMIVPVGEISQRLVILRKKGGKVEKEEDMPVIFVPMVHGQ